MQFSRLGLDATVTANSSSVLQAAHLSRKRFSRTVKSTPQGQLTIKIVVRREDVPPIPSDLPRQLVYSGVENWITVSAAEWGHAFANLSRGEAVIVLSPQLAADTRLVSRYFIDHYLLNFIFSGWAMLHASCVVSPDGEQLIVLVAPHNTGKSTTALRLLRNGYKFLADGMALLRQIERGFEVGGYPIGEVKLRDDVLALFPEYGGQRVQIREQHKTVVNLRQTHPGQLVEQTIRPKSIILCFLERGEGDGTSVETLSEEEAAPLLAGNTLFWDVPEKLAANNDTLKGLLRVASCYQIKTGNNYENLLSAIEALADK